MRTRAVKVLENPYVLVSFRVRMECLGDYFLVGWALVISDQNIMRRRGKSRSWPRVINGRTFASERLRKNKFWSTRASGR